MGELHCTSDDMISTTIVENEGPDAMKPPLKCHQEDPESLLINRNFLAGTTTNDKTLACIASIAATIMHCSSSCLSDRHLSETYKCFWLVFDTRLKR